MGLGFKFSANTIITQGRTSQDDMEAIKTWNKNLEANYVPIIPDELVAIFLLSCSNDIEQTKKTIEYFYKMKKSCPAIFDNISVDSEEFDILMKTTAFALVYWHEENTYIVYVKMLDTNYRNCYMEEQLKGAVMTLDSTLWENPPDNVIIVQDIEGIGLMHLTRLKLDSLNKFFTYIQEGLPMRLKAVHYVNSNFVLNKFMVISKMFIKRELYEKIHFHCGTDGLDEVIPKNYIPSDYNGELPSLADIHKETTIKRLKDMKDYWKEEESMRKQCFVNDS